MSNLKEELILNASLDITRFLDEKYAVEVDIYDIAELININIGFAIDAADKFLEKLNKNGKCDTD